MYSKYQIIILLIIALLSNTDIYGQQKVETSTGVLTNLSSGEFAPYMIGALNGGRVVRSSSALLDMSAKIEIDKTKRFSWGAGVEFLTGYSASNDYNRWDNDTKAWGTSRNAPAAFWIQQLYGEFKYRGAFIRIGQKDFCSALLDETVSSGDLTRSSNARGIPGVEVGFIDFQDIPFTNGWVQIQGTIEYGRFVDDNFKDEQFNRFNGIYPDDINYTYKRCYFRTKPSQPFSVTLGMQATGQFGGTSYSYANGVLVRKDFRGFDIKDLWRMFFPVQGSSTDGYYEGNSLGSWDLKARYRFASGEEISAVFQGPFEDGSGIGRFNKFDGLWGIYYHSNKRSLITAVGLEYLNFTNHSGPLHWATHDRPGTTIDFEATGRDDYYNNAYYGAFTNYGLSIGSPFLISTMYNLNGVPNYVNNVSKGCFFAIKGCLSNDLDYTVKYSYQQSLGRIGYAPRNSKVSNSMLISSTWNAWKVLPGLVVDAKLAFDTGKLRGDNFGFMIGVKYNLNFDLNL